uniref:Ig-like domain-containing protein n=1 Tax=Electrophorus electricus TaxID=8005 RepID=A0A4W4DQS8_ELEEL
NLRMTPLWIFIIPVYKISLAQAVGSYQPSFVSVTAGEAVTLNCTFSDNDHSSLMVWYKQRMGEMPQEVGNILTNEAKVAPEFHSSGIKLERISNGISLIIPHMKGSDEGMYFCGMSTWKQVTFSTGTFLTLKGCAHLNISVVQSPVLGRVPPGESVSLQCTVLSERRTAELQVLWFRAAAGNSHPEIIYTHHNSSHQCEISSSPHSCVYNLSKRVLSLSDTATYYCAVATCGKILLGNGSAVGLSNPLDPVVIFLGAALGVCVLVISVQAVLICKWRNCEHYSGECLTYKLNYAALHFNERKTTRGQVKRGQPEDSVYSEVKRSALTDYHLD